MDAFQFSRPETIDAAIRSGAQASTAQGGAEVRYVAGGTNLIDMMKLNVERPHGIVDINQLALTEITPGADGGLVLGALSRNSDVAKHADVVSNYPVLSQALLAGASPQLRNMASTGGNVLQRTRCMYFRDTAHACNKREPGTGCSAIGGVNRMLAILGTSEHCIATNPSDQNVALAALEATIQIKGVNGQRSVPVQDFYLLPGSTPQRETVLMPGDVITSVTLPAVAAGTRQVYLKLRDRAAYEFALVSAAVVLQLDGKRITRARVALGGVGTKPWRAFETEKLLEGHTVDAALLRKASEAAVAHAKPQTENGFKVDLARRCVSRALTQTLA